LKGIYKITLFLLTILLLAACSRKKNTFINRNFHAVTGEYNTLYNGDVAFADGKTDLTQTYNDNFWELLPVERIKLDPKGTPGEQENKNFSRAEEKAAKAIQKHSMYIDGKEYNPQIDEAYMLLGKSRYYDKRFIPAIDAFNFILDKYPTSNNINRAKVWKAKANIRLRNEDVALENLQKMMDEEELEEEELAEASAMMTQAYINLDSIPEALPYIKLASEYTNDNELRGRYAYIKGQIYQQLEMKDSANLAWQEVIDLNRKSPRIYMINAHMAQSRNFDYEKGDRVVFLEKLYDMSENRENRPFLDKIFNQLGEYYRNTKNIDTAVIFYNKSIKDFKGDQTLQSMNYTTLAEINFDRALYKNAGAYYDSTLTMLTENSRQWRRVKKKRENLDDVIKYETIAAVNDSVLRIAGMSEEQQLAYFTAYTQKLKAKAVADSLENVKNEERIANNEFFQKNKGGKGSTGGPQGGKFYFYNPTTVAYGKQEFSKIWGNRASEDNWRRSEKKSSNIDEEVEQVAAVVPIAENELFKPEAYIAKIPTDQKVLDSLTKDRNFAYYQLGLIYKEKFKEYGLATDRLEKLLTFNPEERLVLPAKYNLYKIYIQTENTSRANKYKDDILSNYATSRYAEIIRNPNSQLATDESSPEFKYKGLYKEFEASNYAQVIAKSDEYITLYNGNDIVPKFELLKATAIGRQDGFDAYKKALNFISLTYPNSDEGKQAETIFSKNLPLLANTKFVADEEAKSFKLVYSFNVSERASAEALREKLEKAVKELNYFNLSTSIDYYDPQTLLVVVHKLNTRLGARGFGENLKDAKAYKIKKPFFEISTPNYKTIQIHKNLNEYLGAGTIE